MKVTEEAVAVPNTDREIWRETPGDYYSPSIHVTAEGGIGIDVGGLVIVMDVYDWHQLANKQTAALPLCERGGVTEPTEEAVAAGATVLANSLLIDAPNLPAPCWRGLARQVLVAASAPPNASTPKGSE